MSQIGTDGSTNDLGFRRPPTHACDPAVLLQAQKCPDRHPDVIALRPRPPHHRPLDPPPLLASPMVHLDPPRLLRIAQPGQLVHLLLVGRPMFRLTVWGD